MTTAMNCDAEERTALLEMSVAATSSCVLVTIAGDVDLNTVQQVRTALEALNPGETRPVIVDVSGLRFIGSLGIHALLDAARALAEHGSTLTLAAPRRAMLRILALTGADELIAVCPTVADAQKRQ